MLVLTRREGEAVRIGDDIIVTVASVRESQIKLGIDAPPEVNVARTKLQETNTPTGSKTKP